MNKASVLRGFFITSHCINFEDMSRSYKNSRSVVPGWFKRLQMRSQKQKQKEGDGKLFSNPEGTPETKFKKSLR